MKARPKDSAVLLRVGLMCFVVGAIASVLALYAPANLFAAFLGLGMFTLGLGLGCVIFSVRMRRLEKASLPPPPPP
jgi:disulfide bond formation protein DsbB